MTTKPKRAAGVTRQQVLDYLIRKADLDGLVTVSEQEVGDALGITRTAAGRYIYSLAEDGLLTILRAASGFKSMNAIQLHESVLDGEAAS